MLVLQGEATTFSERQPKGSSENGEATVESSVLSGEKVNTPKDDPEEHRGESADKNRDVSPRSMRKIMTPSFTRMLMLNKPEWKQGVLGLVGCIGFGFTNPFYAFIIASLTVDYYKGLSDADLWFSIRKYAGILVALAVFFIGANILQHYNFASAGEQLTKRVRVQMLRSILQYEVGWFDKDENSSGSVCSRLATDANMVRVHPLFCIICSPCFQSLCSLVLCCAMHANLALHFE